LTPFSNAEYDGRLQNLREASRRRGLDAVLLDDSEALRYFAGYETSLTSYRACVVPVTGKPFYVLRVLDVAPLRERACIEDVIGHADWEDPVDAIAAAAVARGLGRSRIGLDLTSHALTVQVYERLKARLPDATFVDIDRLPWLLRRRKSPAEIERLRAAARICDAATQYVIDAARVGVTERELANLAITEMARLGADPGLPGVVTTGRSWDMLHGHSHDRRLESGDILHLELLPRVDGYSARMQRCAVIGPVPDHLERTFETLRAAQDMQFEALVPGARARDVDRILREAVLSAGLRDGYPNITGYTLGSYPDFFLRWSDFTWVFHPKADWIVEEGMAFHMYTSASGLGLSETILVGRHGAERLTRMERRLYSVAC
jgi:Xaa-Pro aminopeptidase